MARHHEASSTEAQDKNVAPHTLNCLPDTVPVNDRCDVCNSIRNEERVSHSLRFLPKAKDQAEFELTDGIIETSALLHERTGLNVSEDAVYINAERSDTVDSQVQPGAVHVRGTEGWESGDGNNGQGRDILTDTAETVVNTNQHLAVAHRVSGDTESSHANLPLAAEMMDDVDANAQAGRKRKNMQFLVVLAVVGLVTLVAVVFGTVLVAKAATSESLPTANPTISTTISNNPTQHPTQSPMDYFIKLLPEATLVIIEEDTKSPQAEAFRWMLDRNSDLPNYIANGLDWRIIQRFALATLYFATGGDSSWDKKDNWLDHEVHECRWYHSASLFFPVDANDVEFTPSAGFGFYSPTGSRQGRIEDATFWNNKINDDSHPNPCGEADLDNIQNGQYLHLWLWANGLNGTMPPEILMLTSLRTISLGGSGERFQSLTGPLPSEVGECDNLQVLSLIGNRMDSDLPSELGRLSSVEYLHLPGNDFNRSIPSTLWNVTSLINLDLRLNEFEFQSFPSEVAMLTALTSLDLAWTYLSGTLPTELGLMTRLKWLDLEYNDLVSTIPSEMGLLANLTYLNLRQNNIISGTLPTEIAMMTSLVVFDLAENYGLSGSFPTEIGQMTSLTALDLSEAYLVGTLPSEIGLLSNLESLLLFYNALSGHVVTELGKLSQLRALSLYENSFSGELPSELGNLQKLSDLLLSFCSLSGSVPSELGTMQALEYLFMDGNMFSGTLPSELGLLESLKVMVLTDNQIFGGLEHVIDLVLLQDLSIGSNDIAGELPTEIATMTNLIRLDMHGNQISGSVPSEISLLSSLRVFNLAANPGIIGSLPTELVSMNSLEEVDLSLCTMSGKIPTEFGLMPSLATLVVSDNRLSGSIPSELFSLEGGLYDKRLVLDLSGNQLSGTIPSDIGRLSFSAEFYLGQNQLTGTIPLEVWKTQTNALHLSNNLLSGTISSEIGGMCCLQFLALSNNKLTGTIPTEMNQLNFWQLALTGNEFTGSVPNDIA